MIIQTSDFTDSQITEIALFIEQFQINEKYYIDYFPKSTSEIEKQIKSIINSEQKHSFWVLHENEIIKGFSALIEEVPGPIMLIAPFVEEIFFEKYALTLYKETIESFESEGVNVSVQINSNNLEMIQLLKQHQI